MDSFFYNNYYKYFLWNNGLLEHFFKEGKSEILFHIDKQLLEEIGKIKGIETDDYKEDFISCVEHFCAHYNRYICVKRDPNGDNVCGYSDCKYYSNIFCLKNNRRTDVLAVANHIYTKSIRYFDIYEAEDGKKHPNKSEDGKTLVHAMPFFAIVIYVILKFDNGETQEWANVGNAISAGSRTFIPELWELINQYNNRFDKDASVYDRSNSEYGDYAGRILYHLPLSASTRNKIQDAIYKSSAWKLIDSKTFLEIIGLIMNSLKDVKANEELRNILLKCYSANDYKGISARKVQAVIDDFDIDAYESKIAERRQASEYNQTIVSGEFALGIYFPNDDEGTENSIILLTTVQQSVNEKGFDIKEGKSGTLAGYNTSFVKINKQANIELKDYALKTNKYNIVPLCTEDVIFFYEYDETLYIQTRFIKPAKSYYIAVKTDQEIEFEKWCERNNNVITEKIPNDVSFDLFGANWTIYYTTERINGQYYQKGESSETSLIESENIVMKGGIRKNNGVYFINALPYFEIPIKYNINDVNIYVGLNGVLFEDYTKHTIDNKIILDVEQMPIDSDEVAYMDIGIECGKVTRVSYSINVCGQNIDYNKDFLYKYDKFGIRSNDEELYSANDINKLYQTDQVRGKFSLEKDDFTDISEEFYFANLLAACCFANQFSEITHDRLRKCISYAATRLNIDIQREGFIKNAKIALNKAGLVQIDYTSNKCQAIPPSFMKVPFSAYHYDQLIMLTGCYTRAFLADLKDYCDQNNIMIYVIKNKSDKDEEKLIPPVILLGHNFNPNDFCGQYGHTCDVELDHDFALSLLNVIPSYNDIKSKFKFVNNDSDIFLTSLEASKSVSIPRLRSMKTVADLKQWYIEKQNNYFAEIPQGYMAWASMYCLHEQGSSMIVYNDKEKSVYISNSLMLPNYVHRALYLMNLGLPKQRKVFMCDNPDSNYFSIMSYYHLNSNERREVLVSKLTGNKVGTARKCVHSGGFKMEFWKSRMNGRKQIERYLVLYSDNNVLSIATDGNVYLNCQGVFHRINSDDNMNKILSFLIKEGWNYLLNRTAIGYSRNGGNEITVVYDLSPTELIELPEKIKFNIDKIKII